jgi:hypothetical protein
VYSKAKLPHRPGPKRRARLRNMSLRPWESLSNLEIAARIRSLDTLRQVKKGVSFSSASRHAGVDPRTAKSHLKGYLVKRRGRWHAKNVYNTIEIAVNVYTGGKIRAITINSSSTASLLGHHMSDIKFVLSGRMPYDLFLQRYKNAVITDKYGRKFKLEANLEKLKEIELRKESSPTGDDYYVYEWS